MGKLQEQIGRSNGVSAPGRGLWWGGLWVWLSEVWARRGDAGGIHGSRHSRPSINDANGRLSAERSSGCDLSTLITIPTRHTPSTRWLDILDRNPSAFGASSVSFPLPQLPLSHSPTFWEIC